MDIKLFSFILISLFQLIIALLVLLKNRKKLTNITFFLFTISLITWIFSNYFIDSIAYKVNALIMMRIIFISSGLVPFLMLLFAISLIGLKKKLKIWKVVLLSALPIISTVLCLTNLFIQDINKKQGIWDVTFGSLANIYNFYIFGYFIATLVILYLGFRKAKGLEKVRFQYVFFGLFLTVLFAVTANLVLPLIANNFNLVTIGPFATVFLTGFIAYAIIRHKLFDIRLIIARSIAFVLSIITVGLIYGFIAFRFTAPFIQNLSQSVQYAIFTILAVVLAFTFAPLRRFFEKVTNKIFFRDKYDPQALINSIGQILASEIRLDVLDKRVTHELENQMKVSSAEIVVLDKSSIYYQRLRPGLGTAAKAWPPKRPGLDIKDLMRLGKSLIIADDLQTESERKKIFEKYHISASLALKTKEEFIGFLLLGEK
ncbi:MAG: histidine kinase N-terminal 7TM domain-containing protein, partial [Candidatus Uhrbacteria bacterium]|nr:histidine kinase N-terminal 7TM domain-containing protein [Candidatus Uhrbacteria bacterium]